MKEEQILAYILQRLGDEGLPDGHRELLSRIADQIIFDHVHEWLGYNLE